MTAEKWAEFADTALASSALTTRFADGLEVCSASPVLRRAADCFPDLRTGGAALMALHAV